MVIYFPERLRNQLISAGLEPVLSLTEKIFIASYYIKFSTNIKYDAINNYYKPYMKSPVTIRRYNVGIVATGAFKYTEWKELGFPG